MCRNIKTLFNFEPPVTDDEVEAAALQFVRKVSGMTKPSQAIPSQRGGVSGGGRRDRGRHAHADGGAVDELAAT